MPSMIRECQYLRTYIVVVTVSLLSTCLIQPSSFIWVWGHQLQQTGGVTDAQLRMNKIGKLGEDRGKKYISSCPP